MQLRRSQIEFEKRAEARETLAKKVAQAFNRNNVLSARMLDVPDKKEANQFIKEQGGKWVITQKGTGKVLSHHDSKEKADSAFRAMEMHKHGSKMEETIARQAIHFATNEFKDNGLNSVKLAPDTVEVLDEVTGPKLNLVKTASVRLAASIPMAKNHQVVQRPFFVNLSYNNGRFSVDSLEKNRQLFAVNKASLKKVAEMEEEKEDDKEEEKREATLPESEAVQGAPTNEPHEDDNANTDVMRNADVPPDLTSSPEAQKK